MQPQKKKVVVPDLSGEEWKNKLKLPSKDNREQTEDVTATKGTDFEDLIFSRPLLAGIFEMGFEKPSPVQEECIPLISMGKSVLARAKNGTGKTGAFAIPCLEQCKSEIKATQLLILLPTRELALQTANVLKTLSKYLNLEIVTSTGGTNLKDDIIRLQADVQVVVGTPGRLHDLNKQSYQNERVLRLDQCKMVVLDEADKLLSVDFLPAVENLIEATPADRQLLLFSATFPSAIAEFKEKWLSECSVVNLMDNLTLKGLTQYYAYVPEAEKVHCLYALFRKIAINQCIIFCNSVNRVELLSRKISRLGFPCFYIHGQMGQEDRNRVFHNFRQGECRYLVCTDIFTRGIDIKTLNVVINFDFPRSANTYLHRIGRSGRFGHRGLAINFISDDDRYNLCKIETELNTEVAPIPSEIPREYY
jgi:ATP-dependent RNA helicase DDX6/DHH1